MKLNSKQVGLIILLVIFGGILTFTALGWWQVEGVRQGKGKHAGGSNSPQLTTLYSAAVSYNLTDLSIIDNDQMLCVQLCNFNCNQPIRFV